MAASHTLSVQHLLFSRVEAAYSPQGRNGYQVVHQSTSLSKESAQQIEKRMQCFQTNERDIERYQFFWTDQGQAVITKSVLVEPDREVIDRDARPDAFIAHALILGKEAFLRIRNDPFAVIAAAEANHVFAEDVEQLVQYIREEPPTDQLAVTIRRLPAVEPPAAWSVQFLYDLYGLAQDAASLVQRKESLQFISVSTDDITDLLNLTLFMLEAHERPACTFDTHIDNCTPPPGIFWAIGGTRRVSGTGIHAIYVDEPRIEAKIASQLSPKATPYSAWMRHSLTSYAELSEVIPELYPAQVVAEGFAKHSALPEELLEERVLMNFREANRTLVDAATETGLKMQVDTRIVEDFLPSIRRYLSAQEVLSAAAREQFEPRSLGEGIYRWIVKEQPGFNQWSGLRKLAQTAGYPPLLFLVSAKSRSWNPFDHSDALRIQALDTLEENQISIVLGELHTLLSPADFVTEKTADVVGRYFLTQSISDEAFGDLLKAILKHGGAPYLDDGYVQRVRQIRNTKVASSLAKAVKKVDGVSHSLIEAIEATYNALH
jgi:hypothetical protein